jgi:hypothetical protein
VTTEQATASESGRFLSSPFPFKSLLTCDSPTRDAIHGEWRLSSAKNPHQAPHCFCQSSSSARPAMANVASQIILHPTASATLKILGTTVGRDKVRSSCLPVPPHPFNRETVGVQSDTVLCAFLRVVSHFGRPKIRSRSLEYIEKPPGPRSKTYVASSNLERPAMTLHLIQSCAWGSRWSTCRQPFVQRKQLVTSRSNLRPLPVSSGISVTWPMTPLSGWVHRRSLTTSMTNVFHFRPTLSSLSP